MKNIKYILLIVVSFFIIGNVYAKDVKSISMDINITKDGTAHVTEVWKTSFNSGDEGTELYKAYHNSGESEFKNFKVSLDGKNYTYQNDWDINGSFSEKSYKNGINQSDDGPELCWGITKTGNSTYTLTYDITNFVAGLSDADMVYWTLIPAKIDNIEKTYIKIHSNFDYADDLPVWGYGNKGGTAYVYDGYIEMSLDRTLKRAEYMTILVQFPQGTFNTENNQLDEDFAYYQNMAKEGATEYTEDSSSIFNFLPYILFILVPILGGIFVSNNRTNGSNTIKYGPEGKKIPKDCPYFRDIPCNKDIYRAYWVAKTYNLTKTDTDFLGVVLLKWINEGIITVEKTINQGLFKKEQSKLILDTSKTFTYAFEKELFDMIYEASIDGILEANEFKTWSKANYTEIYSWFTHILDYETEILFKEEKLKKLGNRKYEITTGLLEEATQLKGLKKFLKEFSIINERNPIEVKLWKEYLMFAQMFGIAEKVAKDFKEIYPDVIPDEYMEDFTFIYFVSYTGMHSASEAKSRAESYNSGGGGFSSGGGGGGSFGGGGGGFR